ncbi:transposase (plasmid) [Sinorhizobium kummerowiae]|uniref:IS66-like element accessory protein TnpA n=1 Tax=Sinorhizobium kummerowiae TaxID=158892 RepID=UPI002B4BE234|nr:transposase [Sinorhizobium kummerowiae]WRW48880.1 transposase [Sinorhizobium kummerowiae]
MAKVEILTGAERQRRWSAEQKLSILQEAFGTDDSVSVVARRHDILPQQIYAWRKKFSPPKLEAPKSASFIPVSVIASLEGPADGSKRSGLGSRSKDIEIVLRNGRILRIAADAELELLSALIACVEAS